jgi:hypothetical protein
MNQHCDHLPRDSGLTELRHHGCTLLGFARLALSQGVSHEGRVPAARGALLVILGGKARMLRQFSAARGFDHPHSVRDQPLASLPCGYHTYAGATSCYLWFLAGAGRKQGVQVEPALAWTGKLVGKV